MIESSGESTSTQTSISSTASKHNNKENQTSSGPMSIPIASNGQLASQTSLSNSVIQHGHQSTVIQSPAGSSNALQSQKHAKNALLMGKLDTSSVIQRIEVNTITSQPPQLVNARPEEPSDSSLICSTLEEESKKRREVLARRPSYRKILNELSSAESGSICGLESVKSEPSDSPLGLTHPLPPSSTSLSTPSHLHQLPPPPVPSSASSVSLAQNLSLGQSTLSPPTLAGLSGQSTDQNNNDTSSPGLVGGAHLLPVNSYLKGLPNTSMQLSTANPELLQHGLALAAGNASSANQNQHSQSHQPSIVQYAQAPDSQFFVSLQAYQLRPQVSPSMVISPNSSGNPPHQGAEEAAKKRELRLLKNREAAKECRRKKKAYIKCLEERVEFWKHKTKH